MQAESILPGKLAVRPILTRLPVVSVNADSLIIFNVEEVKIRMILVLDGSLGLIGLCAQDRKRNNKQKLKRPYRAKKCVRI